MMSFCNSTRPREGLPLVGLNRIAAEACAAWSFATSTREGVFGTVRAHARGLEGFSAITTRDGSHVRRSEFLESIKKGLRSGGVPVYGYSAPAKSGARIGVLVKLSATHDAPSVFFCVVSSVHPFFSGTALLRICIRIMVGWAGASSEAPVPDNAGYANPVQSITSEIGVSGDGFNPQLSEAATCWLLSLPKNRNLSGLSQQFAAIYRQFPQKFITSPHRLNAKHAVHWRGITSAFSQAASVWRWLMLKTYDLPYDPLERINHLIVIIDLIADLVSTESDNRDEYLAALAEMLSVATSDLYGTLQSNQLPEVNV
uniref:ash family protein n=1 Tax=Pluralibacter gergoviae TaxID=61647 RepID=UPI000A46F0A7